MAKKLEKLPEPVIQFIVKTRDGYSRPAIIATEIYQKTKLDIIEETKLPKRRLQERRELKERDQMRLGDIFTLPERLEEARKEREKLEDAVQKEIKRAAEQKTPALSNSQPPIMADPSPSPLQITYVSKQMHSNTRLYIGASVCAVSFFMAIFPAFREWVVNKFIVTIDSISPVFFQAALSIEEETTLATPVLAGVIRALYNVFGFWIFAIGGAWLTWKTWDLLTFICHSAKFIIWMLRREKGIYT